MEPGITRNSVIDVTVRICWQLLRKVRPVGPSGTVASLMTAAPFSSQKVTVLFPEEGKAQGLGWSDLS